MAPRIHSLRLEDLESRRLLTAVAFEPLEVQSTARIGQVRLADLDGDQDLDLVTGSYGEQTIQWYTNDGQGAFSDAKIIDRRTDVILDLLAEDVDGDGDTDLVVASPGIVRWYENLNGLATFARPQTLATGRADSWMNRLADLDGDRDLDLITTFGSFSGTLAWSENLGGGRFSASHTISERNTGSAWPGWIEAVDVDHDGAKDLLVSSYESANSSVSIEWFRNDGRAHFAEAETVYELPAGSSLHNLLVTDLDHDGLLDLISQRGRLDWARQTPGNVHFTPATMEIQPYGNQAALAVSDWNRDGMLDIVSAAINYKFVWLPSDKQSDDLYGVAQTVDPEIRAYTDIQVGDLDADGYDDLVVTDYESIHTYRFDAVQKRFERRAIEAAREPIDTIKVVDVDEDGWQDLVTAVRTADNRYSLLSYRNQSGSGAFDEPVVLASFEKPLDWFDLVDLDNDRHLDLVWATNQQLAWQPRASEGLRFEVPIDLLTAAARIRLGSTSATDIDQDGDVDLVVLSENDLHWIENLGSRKFHPQIIDRFDRDIDFMMSVTVGDLDGDRDQDILFPIDGGELVWYEQREGHVFVSRGTVATDQDGRYVGGAEIYDLNDDGRTDILMRHLFEGQLSWLEQTATGYGPLRAIDSTASMSGFWEDPPAKSVVLDIDRDGDLDIGAINDYAERASIVEKLVWYINDGSGQFDRATVVDKIYASGTSSVAAGDFDQDGRADLVLANDNGQVTVYRQRTIGDVDDNGLFDSADLLSVFQLGTYDDRVAGNSDFQSGDWNGDGEFDSSDLVAAFQAGHYQ